MTMEWAVTATNQITLSTRAFLFGEVNSHTTDQVYSLRLDQG
jgi:hypothetical protein